MKIEIKVPAAGESVTEADIASWYKESGDVVEMDEALLELETDKASMDLTAEAAGTLEIKVEDGTTVQVGDVIGYIDTEGADTATATSASTQEAAPAAPTSAPAATTGGDKNYPSPAASKIIEENNLNKDNIQGSGKEGRITKNDAAQAAQTAETKSPTPSPAPAAKSAPETAAPSESVPVGERNSTSKPMSRIRKTIMKRLVDTQQEMALLTTFNEVDLSQVMEIRKRYKEQFKEKYEVGLGFMSFFTKAACIALQEYPVVNSQVDGTNIITQNFCDISIAVSTPKGLVVPVVRNAEKMSFQEIESTILGYAKRGRDGKLTMQDMEGGTFTITNGGVFGSMLSTPIVNRPQSAILGMHNIVKRAVVVNDEVVVRPMMYLALSYDHRTIDGSDAVRFLVKIKELLEDPYRLLINI